MAMRKSVHILVLALAFAPAVAHAQSGPYGTGAPSAASIIASALPPGAMPTGPMTADAVVEEARASMMPPSTAKALAAADPGSRATANQTAVYNQLNQLTSLNGQAQTYDANGNLSSDGKRTFSWDAENRLVKITYADTPGKSTTFTYDGLGHRESMTSMPSGGGTPSTTHYVWCGDRVCASIDGATGAMKQYLAEGEYDGATGQKAYYGVDNLGSVRRVFTSSGSSPAYDYDPYGNLTSSDAPVTDYVYAGLMREPDSGLYLSATRQYDPIAGRWLSRDPAGEDANLSENLYGYVDQNPINFVDPLGLCGCLPPGGNGPIPVRIGAGTTIADPNSRTGLLLQPPGVSLGQNAQEGAAWLGITANLHMMSNFRPSGRMDYQRTYGSGGLINRTYIDFGNYNYGVVAASAGYTLDEAQMGAGVANLLGRGSKAGMYFGNPRNQVWIASGWLDYMHGKITCVK